MILRVSKNLILDVFTILTVMQRWQEAEFKEIWLVPHKIIFNFQE